MDDQLSRLISDAVADVEPNDRLAEIRERTSPRRTRRGWYAAGGVTLAAAAAVTAIALVTSQTGPRADDPGPVATQRPSSATPTAGMSAYPVYYLGDTPFGPRLYREFRRAAEVGSLPTAVQLLELTPQDPDYRTPWPTGSFEGAEVVRGSRIIAVDLADATLHDRPTDMSAADAELAIQQVMYTVQAVAGDRYPVQFRLNGNPIDQVLGVPTSEPLANAPVLEVNALVQLSTPDEGQVFPGDAAVHVTGAANSFESNVGWRLQRWEGTEIVGQGSFMATGYMGERLFPFAGEINLEGIPAGRYLLMVSTDDPSGEGKFFTDTRLITVE
jgi:hypothetical protein